MIDRPVVCTRRTNIGSASFQRRTQQLELIETAVTAKILGLKALPSVGKTTASIRTIR